MDSIAKLMDYMRFLKGLLGSEVVAVFAGMLGWLGLQAAVTTN